MNIPPFRRCAAFFRAFFNRPDFHIRIIAILCALVLAFLAVLLGISIAASLFRIPGVFAGPGDFFANSYGILAFLIPAYILCGALLLADPRYRPNLIFGLSCSLAPFLTLAVGFAYTRDFEAHAANSPILSLIGKVGFSFIIVFLTTMEGLIIVALGYLLFPRGGRSRKRPLPGKAPQAREQGQKPASSLTFLLPPPTKPLRDIYTGSASVDPGLDRYERPPPAGRLEGAWFPGGLPPAARPLSSAAALEELAALSPENLEKTEKTGGEVSYGDLEKYGRGDGFEADDGLDEPLEELALEDLTLEEESPEEDLPEDGQDETEEDDDEAGGGIAVEAEDAAGVSLSPDLAEAIAAADEAAALRSIAVAAAEKKAAGAVAAQAAAKPGKKAANKPYAVPVEGILNQYPDGQYWIIDEATRDAAVTLKETLEEFKIQAEVTGIRKGPVITMFEILPAPGVKLSRIVNLQDNIALRLAASSVRIVAPIPGKHAVGIEVPNKRRNIVSFRELIEGELLREGKRLELPVVLGKDITGDAQTVDLVQMPHLLIAGATGSGKSVCVNAMILSILYQLSPAECRMILIDPKIVELKLYNDIPHLLTPVITEPKRAFQALQYCIYEMERRYACLDSVGVRDIRSYNKRIKERNIASEHLPYIVVVIDEFADLMATTGKDLESTVARLAAMSRAVGIHLVLATQRPSIDVITGLIKANIPSRIAFMVASKMDSRIIIDMVGAEKLLGKGDMLYAGVVDPFPIRMQGAFVSEEEVERVVEQVKTLGAPDYIDDEIFIDDDEEEDNPSLFGEGEDPLYDKALEIVVQQGKASASYIQRRLKIGYNRAARIVEDMAAKGVVGPAQGSRPRELLHGI
jgi:S-DNA-T family DNA segregation ATPase FtsK/SpoIIIE